MFEILRDVDGCPVSIFGQKPVVSIQSRVDTNLSIETAQQFRSLKKYSQSVNKKNIWGEYFSLYSQGRETVYTSTESTCIETTAKRLAHCDVILK